jgi:hypothetical protein
MLKKLLLILAVILSVGAIFWFIIPARLSIEAIAELAQVRVSKETEILSFERISEGREPEFIVSLSVPEGGAKFCEMNKLTDTALKFEPFSPGEKGYDVLLGRPGLCYGIRKLGHGGVYIVVRQSEVVIYVDDR